MRLSIRIDDDLYGELKDAAAKSGRTLTRLTEDLLREALLRRRQPRQRIELPTSGGSGLRGGVDLDNSAALLDLMEGRESPS
jgi:hypothetical protein